jgi:hypothetical protein
MAVSFTLGPLLIFVALRLELVQGGTVFNSKSDLKAAVDSYCSNAAAAKAIHGSIGSWSFPSVTDLSNLFDGKSTCSPDLSSWDGFFSKKKKNGFFDSND